MKKYFFTEKSIIVSDDFIESCSFYLVCDQNNVEKRVEGHIKANDFFGTAATILSLIIQMDDDLNPETLKILNNLKEDLIFLQKNYKIIKK
jgi:hypothetical protein